MRTELFHRNHAYPAAAPEVPPRTVDAPPTPSITPAVFSANVYADAEENCAKIMARKHKRIEEPRLLGKAIRESYSVNPLVETLRKILQELSDERGTRLGFGFSGPTGLVLTQDGFLVTEPSDADEADVLIVTPLPESLNVGADGTCATTRLQLDSQLTQFAKTPETFAMPVMDRPQFDAKAAKNAKDNAAKTTKTGKRKPARKPRRGLASMPLVGKLFR